MTNHNSSDPPSTWRALCAEAEAIVIRGEKFLLLDEEMTFRMGEALELAAGVGVPRHETFSQQPPTGQEGSP